jgi:hypothetical protein
MSCRQLVIVAVGCLCFSGVVVADQGPPYPIEASLRHATSIVDATVAEITEAGAAKLEVHQILKGPKTAPKLITGYRTDTNQLTPSSRDLKKGSRYVLLLRGDLLADYGHYRLHAFEIRKSSSGELECHVKEFVPDEKGKISFGSRLSQEWQPLAKFTKRIKATLKE